MVDAVVVGAGPNGLVAAITLAQAGRSVVVLEAAATIGGGARSAELTLPGFIHDVCSAVHPLAAGSPVLNSMHLDRYGLRYLQPEVALAHPLDGGRAGAVSRDIGITAGSLGVDASAWRRHIGRLAGQWDTLAPMLLRPLPQVPRHPLELARFGVPALTSSHWLGRRWFNGAEAQALFAGCAAHSMTPVTAPLSSSIALVLLASAHARGWPVAEGGSGNITQALGRYFIELGGQIETNRLVTSLGELPDSRAVLFDVTPADMERIAGDALPSRFRRRLRAFRAGPGAFKIDYALDGPVPWINEACRRAGTVHVCGDAEEVARAEADVAAGRHPRRPFVLVAQQTLVDPSRAPAGKHTFWAYCHVPNASTVDMTAAIESQIERFAPGFGDLVLARHTSSPRWFENYNRSYVGGDIAGGANDGLQMLLRPVLGRPYRTPNPELFICSASTPPGAGVHGMCGVHAARSALAGVLR